MERTEMLATKSLNITDELMYQLPSSKKSQISRREHVSKSADGSQTANPSQTIIFTIPPSSNKVLAGSETYFSFNVASVGAATLGGSVHRLIERVRILSDSGVVLEELNAFNVLNRSLQITHMADDYLNEVEVVSGFNPRQFALYNNVQDQLSIATATVSVAQSVTSVRPASYGASQPASRYEAEKTLVGGIDFYFRLEGSGLLNQEKFLPLFAMGLRIELTLESAAIGLRTGTEYVVSNPKIYYTVLTMSDQLAATMSEALRKGPLHLPYSTFSHKSETRDSASYNIALTQPYFRLKKLFSTVRLTSALSANNDSFNYISTDLYSSGKGVQYRYNDQYYPIDKIDNAKRSYYESRIALNQFGSVELATLPYIEFVNGGRHVLCANFETLMSDPQSGSSTKNSRSIDMSLEFSSSASRRIDVFSQYVRILRIRGDSTIEVLE